MRGCVGRASRGAYLQQLQLLAQHPEQAPSAAAADPSAMLASLLANPGLLHAISTPPGHPMSRSGADIGLGHCTSTGPAPDAKKSMDGGSSDDTTIAGDPASFLQLRGPAISHPLLRPVPIGVGQRPNAATGHSVSAPAPGPDLMTSVFANSALAGSRSMPQVGHYLAEPAGASLERSRSGSDGLAGYKRSFSGDVKGGTGLRCRPRSAARWRRRCWVTWAPGRASAARSAPCLACGELPASYALYLLQ